MRGLLFKCPHLIDGAQPFGFLLASPLTLCSQHGSCILQLRVIGREGREGGRKERQEVKDRDRGGYVFPILVVRFPQSFQLGQPWVKKKNKK